MVELIVTVERKTSASYSGCLSSVVIPETGHLTVSCGIPQSLQTNVEYLETGHDSFLPHVS
jgi:hypothetical protein